MINLNLNKGRGIGNWALGIGHWALGLGPWALGIVSFYSLFPLPSSFFLLPSSFFLLPSSFFTFFPQHPTLPSSLQLELIPNYPGHFAASATIRSKPGARLFSNRLTLLRGQNPSGVADRQEFVEQ